LAWEAAQRTEPVEVRDPAEALLAAAREADVMAQRLRSRLDANGLLDASSVEALGQWLDRVARISKIVLDARVDERRLRISEARGNYWAAVIKEILAGLALTPEQWSRADLVVRQSTARVLERRELTPG
jgi:hypothetical protein